MASVDGQSQIYLHGEESLCSKCNSKVNIKCNDISVLEYEKLLNGQSNAVPQFCKNCTIDGHASLLPFGTDDNEELSYLFYFEIYSFSSQSSHSSQSP